MKRQAFVQVTSLRYNFLVMPENTFETKLKSEITNKTSELLPTAEELSVLSDTEKIGFRLADKMNRGAWKRFWTFCQRHIGSLWIYLATYNLMNVFGLENIEQTDAQKPLLLVANHRSFFDMYTVSSVLFRQTKRPIKLFFPVRAKFFYDSPLGWFVNFVMGWFSMFPPFFREDREMKKREFDKFSMRKLVEICSVGKAHVIGFHPEGKRNTTGGTYEFLPAQTGVGKIIMASRPQVVPVFIAGLGNDLPKQILGNWRGGEKIRIHFGAPIDLSEFYEKRDSLRTHKEIADFLMVKIGELAEEDKKNFGLIEAKNFLVN
jgi:1-acyl-sn-glycerol-3-phosphate acyltransferase